MFAVFMTMSLACGSAFLLVEYIPKTSQSQQDQTNQTNVGNWFDVIQDQDIGPEYGTSGGRPGTESNPLIIDTAERFAFYAYQISIGEVFSFNDYVYHYNTAHYVLTNNIDLSGHYWTPIGGGEVSFQGYIDGRPGLSSPSTGFAITNVFITLSGEDGKKIPKSNTAGLFAKCENATIKNLTVSNIKINVSQKNSQLFRDDLLAIGGLVGYAKGCTISNVVVDADESTIKYILGENQRPNWKNISLGGIVGYAESTTIDNCQNEGFVTVDSTATGYRTAGSIFSLGGIVGNTIGGTITKCINFRGVKFDNPKLGCKKSYVNAIRMGGIAGSSNGTITNCYNNGDVFTGGEIRIASDISSIGGICGWATGTVSDSCNYGNSIAVHDYTNGEDFNIYVGGVIGYANNIEIDSCGNYRYIRCYINDNAMNGSYGGVLGYGDENCTITNSVNYGNFYFNKSGAHLPTIKAIGGIAGTLKDGSTLYKTFSAGEIEISSGISEVVSLGGIVGEAELGSTGKIEHSYSVNKVVRSINSTTLSKYGEVIGFLKATSSITGHVIESCATEIDGVYEIGAYVIDGTEGTNYDINTNYDTRSASHVLSKAQTSFETNNGYSTSSKWHSSMLASSVFLDYSIFGKRSVEIPIPMSHVGYFNVELKIDQIWGAPEVDESEILYFGGIRESYYLNPKKYSSSIEKLLYLKGYSRNLQLSIANPYYLDVKYFYDNKWYYDKSPYIIEIINGKEVVLYLENKSVYTINYNYYIREGNNYSGASKGEYGEFSIQSSNSRYYYYIGEELTWNLSVNPGYYVRNISFNKKQFEDTDYSSKIFNIDFNYSLNGKLEPFESKTGVIRYNGATKIDIYFVPIDYKINITYIDVYGNETKYYTINNRSYQITDTLDLTNALGIERKEGYSYTLSYDNKEISHVDPGVQYYMYKYSLENIINNYFKHNYDQIDGKNPVIELVYKEQSKPVNVWFEAYANSLSHTEVYSLVNYQNKDFISFDGFPVFQEGVENGACYSTVYEGSILQLKLDGQMQGYKVNVEWAIKTNKNAITKPEDLDNNTGYKGFGDDTFTGGELIEKYINIRYYEYILDGNYFWDEEMVQNEIYNSGIHIMIFFTLTEYDLYVETEGFSSSSINVQTYYYQDGIKDKYAIESINGMQHYKIYSGINVGVSVKDNTAGDGNIVIRGEGGTSLDAIKTTNNLLLHPNYNDTSTGRYIFNNNKLSVVYIRFEYETVAHLIESIFMEPPKVNNIYQISTADHLKWLAEQVNLGNSFENVYFKQINNIKLTGNFIPIGTKSTPFKGIYDGGGYIISGLNTNNYLNKDFTSWEGRYGGGLFGVTNGATIKNLTLMDGFVTGWSYVGGFVGYAINTTFENLNNHSVDIQATYIPIYNLDGSVATYYYKNLDSLTLIYIEARNSFGGIAGKAENCSFYECSSRADVCYSRAVNQANVTDVSGFLGNGSGNCTFDTCFAEAYVHSATQAKDAFTKDLCTNNDYTAISSAYNSSSKIKNCYSIIKIVHSNGGVSIESCLYYASKTGNSGYYATYKDFYYNVSTAVKNLSSSEYFNNNGSLNLKAFYWV